jgi:hypothetical protein
MNRLIKKLNSVRQPEPQPMGFMLSSVSSEKSRMLIVATLKAESLEKLADGLKTADAVLIDAAGAAENKTIEKFCQTEEGIPAGRWLRETGDKALRKALETACDFVVFNSSAPVSATRNEKIGRILELDINLSEGLLRTAGDLPIDGVLIPSNGAEPSLTIHNLMHIQRLANMLNKPILVSISAAISAAELQSLWDMGICGVVVDIIDENSVDILAEIRQKIEKLGPPTFRKKAKMTAILPQSHAEKAVPEEDQGEEEEEDE